MVTIADFHKAFLEAEVEIKFAELSIDSLASVEDEDYDSTYQPRGVVIPAINELRYAAKHLSCAMQENVAEEYRSEQLHRAIRHCVRARLDALRAVVLFFARDFWNSNTDTGTGRLSGVVALSGGCFFRFLAVVVEKGEIPFLKGLFCLSSAVSRDGQDNEGINPLSPFSFAFSLRRESASRSLPKI